MSSPLATFRKHRTYWMAGLVLLAIMAFVVAPLFDYMQGRIQNSDSGDQVVVRWNGGRLTMSGLLGVAQGVLRFGLGVQSGPGYSDLTKSKKVLFWDVK